jgi:Family of unknown function (DUF6011)
MTFNITPVNVEHEVIETFATGPSVPDLLEAAARFEKRTDYFAQGKGEICRDMARSLERDGHYRSVKQRDFAAKLVLWATPRQPSTVGSDALFVKALFAIMQRHAKFYAGYLTLARKNGESLCWIMWNDKCVGKIENAEVTLWRSKFAQPDQINTVLAMLREFDADPLAAAVKYGKLSGTCCSCGRDLTNDGSIEAGIGPICAKKFA